MQYDLIFEGGGVRGLVFAGAMAEFEARCHTFDRLLGTSAGGITATLFAAGYRSHEAFDLLYDASGGRPTFANFLAQPLPVDLPALRQGVLRTLLQGSDAAALPDWMEGPVDDLVLHGLTAVPALHPLLNFLEHGYWCSDQPLLDWLATVLDSGAFGGEPRRFSTMTLEAFFRATAVELSLIASDITASRMLILNHRTAPDCPLLAALRMTTSLPLIWPQVTWRDAWGTYTEEDISGHLISDGSILSTFPIELLLSDQPEVTAWVGEKRQPHVLGLLIDEALPVPGAPPFLPDPTLAALGGLPAVAAVVGTLDAAARAADKATVNAVEQHIVRLPGKGFPMLEFAMTPERFNALISAGRQAMQRYFTRHERAPFSPEALLDSTAARQYIDASATRQLSRIIYNYYINTEGGAYIGGDVATGGGDFAGRDVRQP